MEFLLGVVVGMAVGVKFGPQLMEMAKSVKAKVEEFLDK